MLVIENENYDSHNPHWVYTLGPNTYQTRDTPARVEAIKVALQRAGGHRFRRSRRFPEIRLAELHPYHAFIKKTSRGLTDPREELYPDLFPGEGAQIPRRTDRPLWAGIYCTDAVTPITMHTYDVARGSAEAALTAAKLIAEGAQREVYALCRPSGHHAGPRVFGGYCYFNNAALAGRLLMGLGQVAILDIDYHHGNGTQEFFYSDPRVLTASLHGDPDNEYPYFWGYAAERGLGRAEGTNLNLPLPPGSENGAYLKALDKAVAAVEAFVPVALVIAAGFDTHQRDPIGGLDLTTRVYPEIGRRLGRLGLPTVICQEGGYNTEVLGDCVAGFLDGFLAARR